MPFLEHEADHVDDADQPARCPRRLAGAMHGPRCRALVLVRDAREHGAWHDVLDQLLGEHESVELEAQLGLSVADADDLFAGDDEPDDEPAVTVSPAIDRPAGL